MVKFLRGSVSCQEGKFRRSRRVPAAILASVSPPDEQETKRTTAAPAHRPARKARPEGTFSRRTVLAAAAAGGAGVAAARLLASRNQTEGVVVPITGGLANARGLDWVSPLGNPTAKAAHLLRRTTFGYTPAELEQAQSDGFAKTVDRLLETPTAEPPELAGAEAANQVKGLPLFDFQLWWVDHMLNSPTPFAERMTLFWHGHFTSDYRKVGLQSPFLYWQNLTWRRMALGDLRTMLFQVTTDPAMLRYLDLGNSTGRAPNENYSRELMELFSMGADTFNEDDVRSGAKALAGWREPRTPEMVQGQIEQTIKNTGKPPATPPTADTVKTGVFDRNRAFVGGVSFLGTTKQWDAESVIDQILKQDATAPYLVRKLVTHFVTPTPTDAYVKKLSDGFRRSGFSVKSLLRDMFTSPEFVAPSSYRALIKSPMEFMVSTLKALRNPTLARLVVNQSSGLGQALYDPPSVGGWPQNESWVSSNAMLTRTNFVTAAIQQTRQLPPSDTAHAQFLDSTLGPQTLKLLNEANDDKRRWALLLVSPEFQLK